MPAGGLNRRLTEAISLERCTCVHRMGTDSADRLAEANKPRPIASFGREGGAVLGQEPCSSGHAASQRSRRPAGLLRQRRSYLGCCGVVPEGDRVQQHVTNIHWRSGRPDRVKNAAQVAGRLALGESTFDWAKLTPYLLIDKWTSAKLETVPGRGPCIARQLLRARSKGSPPCA